MGEIEEGRRWKCVGNDAKKTLCPYATAKERLFALHVVALAKFLLQVFQSATVKECGRNWATPLRYLWWYRRSRSLAATLK